MTTPSESESKTSPTPSSPSTTTTTTTINNNTDPQQPLPTLTSKPAYLRAVTYTGTTVLYATAPWCAQCKVLLPTMHALAAEFPDTHFFAYDVDGAADIAHELGVTQVPTVSVFRDGDYVESVSGAKGREVRRAVVGA